MTTIADVAREAGVSTATVSYVLNGREKDLRISETTRDHVLKVAEEVGYRRNHLMRAVLTGKNPVFGFISPRPQAEYIGAMLVGALEEAQGRGYFVKVFSLGASPLDESHIKQFVEMRMAGLIVMHQRENTLQTVLPHIERYHLPLVFLDTYLDIPNVSMVCSDDDKGMKQAVHHLRSLGHERIGFVSGFTTESVRGVTGMNVATMGLSLRREKAFEAAMRAANLPFSPSLVTNGDFDIETTERVTRELMSDPVTRPTALIAITDPMALVVMRTLAQMGLAVPNQVSVVGFGNLQMGRFSAPALTTIEQPFQEIGRRAVQLLWDELNSPPSETTPRSSAKPRETLLPTSLVVRQSTAEMSA